MKLSSKYTRLSALVLLGLSAGLAGCQKTGGPDALPPEGATPAAATPDQPPPGEAEDGASVGPGPEPAAMPPAKP